MGAMQYFPKFALLFQGLLMLMYCYYFMAAPELVLDKLGYLNLQNEKLWPLLVGLMRYTGMCFFVFAFLYLHMVPSGKVKNGLRTALMLNLSFVMVGVYRVFVENQESPNWSEASSQASLKSLSILCFASNIAFVALLVTDDDTDAKKKTA
eukprot:g3525.t1